MLKPTNRIAAVLLSLLITSGCSILSREKAPGATGTTPQSVPVSIESMEPERAPDIELVWQLSDPVDAFLVRYGSSPDDLKNEVRVEAKHLDTLKDPDFGSVYRYVLKGVPGRSSIFVSIAAIKDGIVSPPSPVFESKADENDSKPLPADSSANK